MAIFESEWDEYLYNLQSCASRQFRQDGSYKLLQENLERAESDCRLRFAGDDHACIEAWIEAVMRIDSEESGFLYRQAFLDCVSLLKALHVLT